VLDGDFAIQPVLSRNALEFRGIFAVMAQAAEA
jgi:hypothetical protein